MATEDKVSRAAIAAVGAAGVALVVAVIAVVVVLNRDDAAASRSELLEVEADAAAVHALLDPGTVEVTTGGLALIAPKALGLEPGDVLTTFGGIPLHELPDLYVPLRRAGLGAGATSLLLELDRGGQHRTVRVTIRGDFAALSRHPGRPALLPGDPLAGDPPVAHVDDDDEAALLAGITKLDDTHYVIARDSVDKILANPMAVAKGARVLPSSKDGKPNGFKLYAIRPSSMYAKLGFSNGDTITSINGLDLTTMDQAMEVYSQLRDATDLEFSLIRRGQPERLMIQIR